MVGGKVIEVRHECQPETGRAVVRLWALDSRHYPHDECAVWTEPADELPEVGDDIWWQAGQAGQIMWTPADRRFVDRPIPKIGYSFRPSPSPLEAR